MDETISKPTELIDEEKAKAQKAAIEQMLKKRRTGNRLKIRDDYDNHMVVLIFDNVEYPVPLKIAREYALQIRQSANRVEKAG